MTLCQSVPFSEPQLCPSPQSPVKDANSLPAISIKATARPRSGSALGSAVPATARETSDGAHGQSMTFVLELDPAEVTEAALMRRVNHWHQQYLDAEASLAEARANEAKLQLQLTSALGELTAKSLEPRRPTEDDSVQSRLNQIRQLRGLEQQLQAKDSELWRLREELRDRDSALAAVAENARMEREVDRLRAELARKESLEDMLLATEKALADTRRELHVALSKIEGQGKLIDAREQEVQALREEVAKQTDAHRRSVQDVADMRVAYSERLMTLDEQEANHQKLIEALRAEKTRCYARIECLEKERLSHLATQGELERLQGELKKKECVEETIRVTERALAETRKELHVALNRMESQGKLIKAREQETQSLRQEVARQTELCKHAVQDAVDVRAAYSDRLMVLDEQEAKHQKLIEALRFEKTNSHAQIDYLEKVNEQLEFDLQSCRDTAARGVLDARAARSVSPRGRQGPCPVPPPARELRQHYPRRPRSSLGAQAELRA